MRVIVATSSSPCAFFYNHTYMCIIIDHWFDCLVLFPVFFWTSWTFTVTECAVSRVGRGLCMSVHLLLCGSPVIHVHHEVIAVTAFFAKLDYSL